MHLELDGPEFQPVEEINIVVDDNGKKKRKANQLQKYAPLIFEECFIRARGSSRIANNFELEQDASLKQKSDPSVYNSNYKGMHLFVLSHGFQGSSYDVRIFKNIISIALPDALFLCAQANERDTD